MVGRTCCSASASGSVAPAMTAVGLSPVASTAWVVSAVAVGEADVQDVRIKSDKKIILMLYELGRDFDFMESQSAGSGLLAACPTESV